MQEMREPSPPSPNAPLISDSQLRSRRDSVANILTMRHWRRPRRVGSRSGPASNSRAVIAFCIVRLRGNLCGRLRCIFRVSIRFGDEEGPQFAKSAKRDEKPFLSIT